jgi:hypothetical protein
MKRSILIGSVLTLALFCALSAGSPTAAGRCGWENCVAMYNECEASCNGIQVCIKRCQREYSECQCNNCGLCPINEQQAASTASTSRVAVSPGTANGYALTFPTDTFFQRWRAVP